MEPLRYAVILAGGMSTRTYPLTIKKPKPLLKVRDKTIIEHNLAQLSGLVEEVVIVIGYLGKIIQDFLKVSYKGLNISYVEQKEQLGTGHALLQVRDKVKGRFIVLNGDDLYSSEDIQECINHNYSILAMKVSTPEKFGVLTLDYNNCLKDLIEKPAAFVSNIANTGLYVLDEKIFDELKTIKKTERGELELTCAVKSLSSKEEIYCHTSSSYWIPIGYPADLLKANNFLLAKIKQSIKGVIEEGAVLDGKASVKEGAVIEKKAVLKGPVVIGKNSVVKGLISNSSIGDNCSIGNNVEITNSLIMDNVKIEDGVKIINSVLSDNVIVKQRSALTGAEDKIVVIGENVIIEEDNTINSGISIWPDKQTEKNKEITGDIE